MAPRGSEQGSEQVMAAPANEYGIAWLDSDPFTLNLWRVRDAGHAIYDGEPCLVSGDPDSCDSCALLSAHIG
jgi:hypothetical protein